MNHDYWKSALILLSLLGVWAPAAQSADTATSSAPARTPAGQPPLAAAPRGTPPAPVQTAPAGGAGTMTASGSQPTSLALRQGLSEVPSLTLFMELRDDQGRAVTAIDKNRLLIEVGPYPTRIDSATHFAEATGPEAALAAIFLVDVSKSVPEAGFVRVREAINQWADSLGPHDRMAIVTFGETVMTTLDFTHQRDRIQDAVAGLKPTDKRTRLYDALLRGLDMGLRLDQDIPRRRVIVLLSDGQDDVADGANFQQVFARMEESPLPVYAIAFDPGGNPARREQGRRALGGLARASGGELLEVVQNRFTEAYATARRHIADAITVRVHCAACPPDGRVYPVQISLNEAGRIVTGAGHVRLLPGEAATRSSGGDIHPLLAWLPASIRPYWGILLGSVLALIAGMLLLMRLRRAPVEPEPTPALEVAPVPDTQAIGPAVIPLDAPTRQAASTRAVRQEDPGIRIRLSLVEGKRHGHSWGFMLQQQTSLGRSPSNDVVLSDDPQISSRHCVLIRERDKIFVQDSQSMNGTFVNGVEIKARYLLEDGDILGLGNTTLRITWSGA